MLANALVALAAPAVFTIKSRRLIPSLSRIDASTNFQKPNQVIAKTQETVDNNTPQKILQFLNKLSLISRCNNNMSKILGKAELCPQTVRSLERKRVSNVSTRETDLAG